jgi:flagellar hook-basal body complex protein FliE
MRAIVTNRLMSMWNAIETKPNSGSIRSEFKAILGFSRTEINRIQKLVEEHQEQLLAGWNDFFND